MTIKEMRDKIAKLRVDARALISGDAVTAEQLTQSDAMLTEVNTLTTASQRIEQFEAEETRSAGSVGRGAVDGAVDTRGTEERRAATGIALRNYLSRRPFEARDLTVAGNGSLMIPTAVADPKIARKYAGSVYDLVYKLRTSTGEKVISPLLNDTTQGFVLNSTAITVTDPTTAGVTISIDDIRSNPILLENSLIQDADFDLVGFIETAVGSRYTRTVSNWITNGNASNVGALTTIVAGITAATTLVVGYKDLVNLMVALDPAYAPNAAWTMANATLGSILNIVDGNARPIFLPYNDGATSGFAGTILGFPVKLNPYQPLNGIGNKFIQFGDFQQGYTFREVVPGIMLKRSDERWIELNKVGFVAFARVGGACTDAGTSPIQSLIGK